MHTSPPGRQSSRFCACRHEDTEPVLLWRRAGTAAFPGSRPTVLEWSLVVFGALAQILSNRSPIDDQSFSSVKNVPHLDNAHREFHSGELVKLLIKPTPGTQHSSNGRVFR